MTTEPRPAAVIVGGVSGSRGSRRPEDLERLAYLAEGAWAVDGNAERAIRFAVAEGAALPQPGSGHTVALFDALATVAAADLTAARVLEAHTDALAILQQAPADGPWGDSAAAETDAAETASTGAAGTAARGTGEHSTVLTSAPPPDSAPAGWGVFAAEGPGQRVDAVHTPAGWRLTGRKPWCSLAGSLSHALVTAYTTGEGEQPARRRLFAVDLADPGVTVLEDAWFATGLAEVSSGPVDFAEVPAVPVGEDGWYLTRPGFSWGGIQVAACWWGGAVGVARQLRSTAEQRSADGREPDQLLLAHLGAVDLALLAAGAALFDAAAAIDRGEAVGASGALLAARVRGLVARTVDEVLHRVGHALGPAPLALNARHARRVADLGLYVRQHHAERDDAALGGRLLTQGAVSW